MRIQISDDMRNALLEFGNKYIMTERGEIEVYVSTLGWTVYRSDLSIHLCHVIKH